MFRLALIVVVTVGMAHLGYCCFTDAGRSEVNLDEIQATTQRLDATWENLRLFRARLHETLDELMDEEITLAKAIDRVLEAGRTHHPIYLQMLTRSGGDATIQEQIGHNLIGQLADETKPDGHQDHRDRVVCRLKTELASMFPGRKG